MNSRLSHMQFNVQPDHLPFYGELLGFMGWQPIFDGTLPPPEGHRILGLGAGNASLWFIGHTKAAANDYDGPGMNHLAIGVDAEADVDAVAAYLQQRKVALLFDTPRHRPEFADGDGQTYYQVMFESPDRVLLEVVYTGPKSA